LYEAFRRMKGRHGDPEIPMWEDKLMAKHGVRWGDTEMG
jgi:hypothetical protein